MVRRLLLHIGTHRTGARALQRVLAGQTNLLQRAGYAFWPASPAYHRTLHALEPAFKVRLDLECDRVEALARRVRAGTLIWSCEGFSGRACNGYADAGRLAHNLRHVTRSFETDVFLYVRRQDLFLESRYAEAVRAGKTWDARTFLAGLDPVTYDWYRLAEAFAAYFGRERVHVRPYERAQLAGGDTVLDFFTVAGMPWPEEGEPSSPVGVGYDRVAVEIARRCNAVFDGNERKLLAQLLQATGERRPHGPFSLFDPATRERLVAAHAASNARLARVFLGRRDGVLFREPVCAEPPVPVALAEVAGRLRRTAAFWRERLPEPQRRGMLEPFLQRVASVLRASFAGAEGAATVAPVPAWGGRTGHLAQGRGA
ncbi:hypothetical protein GQ464_001540 [Rhodocaloribacter litoris]|uniref:hypothetical protein n=1 Tax=Rhodocaloribacter litoris TaxID=2558931 RepID=UPI001423ECD6|nr:hypothetical protein [Rhodocaloribacter litoris]QXD15655.1 hypothetical protein GQ464_001540 [Rhodocaloribacter litoris]